MIDRRLVASIDWVLLGATLLLALIGVLMVYSATEGARRAREEGRFEQGVSRSDDGQKAAAPVRRARPAATKQMIAAGLGLLALLVVLGIDYHRLTDRAVLLYVASAVALVAALAFGPRIAGTKRWFVIGGFQVQPSEFVKVAAALFLARVFGESRHESLGLREVLPSGLAVSALFLLIAAAPDLGTAACLMPLFFAVTTRRCGSTRS